MGRRYRGNAGGVCSMGCGLVVPAATASRDTPRVGPAEVRIGRWSRKPRAGARRSRNVQVVVACPPSPRTGSPRAMTNRASPRVASQQGPATGAPQAERCRNERHRGHERELGPLLRTVARPGQRTGGERVQPRPGPLTHRTPPRVDAGQMAGFSGQRRQHWGEPWARSTRLPHCLGWPASRLTCSAAVERIMVVASPASEPE